MKKAEDDMLRTVASHSIGQLSGDAQVRVYLGFEMGSSLFFCFSVARPIIENLLVALVYLIRVRDVCATPKRPSDNRSLDALLMNRFD